MCRLRALAPDGRCKTFDAAARVVPIGYPVANTRVHILDPRMQPVPIGVAGEIYPGGIRVGRGYWSRPALTAEKFVPDPLTDQPGQRLYRTGDAGRYREDGTMVSPRYTCTACRVSTARCSVSRTCKRQPRGCERAWLTT